MAENPIAPSDDELKRKIVFVPCKDKKTLHSWIKVFLDIDLPDAIIDPGSNCSPMDMVWEVYERAIKNDDPDFDRVLYYASRDSFKTLGASIIEVLAIVHMNRSVAHMAAIEPQAQKAQSYVKKFLSRPFLRDFVVGENAREIKFVRYYHPETGENLTLDQWSDLPDWHKDQYHCVDNYIKIVICTPQGANSEHVPLFVIDEVDVVENPRAYEEAQMIPAEMNGFRPITVLTSTRKYSIGLVQAEIDKAEDSGLKIRHWNLIDVTKACPTERHLPEEPKIPIYYSNDFLTAISEDAYKSLSSKEQEKYERDIGYAGCLKNCKIFAQCRGRLATKQTSDSKLLKSIHHTQNQFRGKVSVQTAKAQLMCWKPSTEGLIYPYLEPELHKKTAAEMAAMVTGDETYLELVDMTKNQLIDILKKIEGGKFFSGMDFGFSHNFAVVTGFVLGDRCWIIDTIAMPELDADERIQICRERIAHFEPLIFADPAEPGSIKIFKKAGFRMKEWTKGKGSLLGGIDIVRMKIRPATSEPKLYFLKGDEGVDLLFHRMTRYHWKLSPDGRISNIPNDTDDDECDAVRYMLMNVFEPKGKFAMAGGPEPEKFEQTIVGGQHLGFYDPKNWMKQIVHEKLGSAASPSSSPTPGGTAVKKGRFIFDV